MQWKALLVIVVVMQLIETCHSGPVLYCSCLSVCLGAQGLVLGSLLASGWGAVFAYMSAVGASAEAIAATKLCFVSCAPALAAPTP
jgi:hypothetical protein